MDETRQLIFEAQAGNQTALNQLFRNWYGRVYNTAYKYFSDAALAKEVSQQTFVVVQEKLGQLRDLANFKVWLYRITMNQCHEQIRKQKTRSNYEEKYGQLTMISALKSPDTLYENNEQAQLIMRAIQRLPEEQRTVLIMKEYEGLKFREIADTLDISENTAKSRLYYGLKALRKMDIFNR
ncbi:MAG: RNA polymerase sigma factor [Bacteroidota bacterium]